MSLNIQRLKHTERRLNIGMYLNKSVFMAPNTFRVLDTNAFQVSM